MKWVTWDQAAIAALITAACTIVLRRIRPTKFGTAMMHATQELSLVAALYSIWRIAKRLPLTHNEGAIERARDIVRVQDWLQFPTELSVQHFVLKFDWLGRFSSYYYGIAHVPALIVFLIWLFVRHRDHYPHWRNGLAILTAFSLFLRFVRVAPPRFLIDLGYIDLSEKYGPSIYGPVGTGVSDQFAAMPSIHVGWAAVIGLGVVAASDSGWRWLFALHLPITFFVVSSTGHHWWLDGIVSIALLWIGLLVDTRVRRLVSQSRSDSGPNSGDSDLASANQVELEPSWLEPG
jgi:hypothetical protein